MPFAATWMDLEIIIQSKLERDRYHMMSHMWNLKYEMNISMKQKQTHKYREQTCGC